MIDCVCNRCCNNKAVYKNIIALPGQVGTLRENASVDNHISVNMPVYLCEDCQKELNRWTTGV